MNLREAAEDLNKTMEGLRRSLAQLAAPPQQHPEVAEIKAEISILLEAGKRIETSVGTTYAYLDSLNTRLSGDLLDNLHDRLQKERELAEQAFSEAIESFESLGGELVERAGVEMEAWLVDAIETLTSELTGAVEEIKSEVTQGAKRLGDGAAEEIGALSQGVQDRVAQRARDSMGNVVESVTQRTMNEVAETIVTTQVGAMVTTTIAPYLPAIIAIKPALPAIQEALDVMRGGL